MKWYERYGFIEDPFGTGRGMFVEKAVLLKGPAEELAYNIEAGNMVALEGAPGTGKTTLLHKAIERFRGERKVAYFDCSRNNVDIKKLVQGKYGFFGRLLNITPKDMVLLLDNFDELSKKDIERAKYYYDNNFVRSIVFAGDPSALPENILDRIGSRIIRLKPLTAEAAVELVKNRMGSLETLGEKMVRKIFGKSKRDAKAFLEYCSKACEAAAEAGSETVNAAHLKGLRRKK